tara:strand:- start:588 stop:1505 length:918 start_codon:yes stop_codon:yes gene_type:complete
MARTTRPIETDYSFGVEKIAHVLDGEETGWHGVRRIDLRGRASLVGMCKDNYEITTNEELVKTAQEAFTALGAEDYEEKLFCTQGGSRFYGEYTFKNKQIELPKVGDTIGLRLTLNNSYDRSCKIGFSMGFLRLICGNGMVTDSRDFMLQQLHSGKLDLKNVQTSMKNAFNAFDADSLEVFGGMAAKPINQKAGEIILDNLAIKEFLSAQARDSIRVIWEDPENHATGRRADIKRNVFNLYNACTDHFSHSENFGYSKFENQRATSRKVFKQFARFASSESELTKWSTRFPEKEKVSKKVETAAN